MRFLIANLTMLCLLAVAHADDGWVEVKGGSARLLQEHPTVSMTDEYVLIEMSPEKYKVTAKFDFYNSGESTTVAVGFPVSGSSEAKRKDFLNFKTWVNGSSVSVSKLQEHPEESEYEYFKVKTVQFVSQSTTTSIVEYEAPYGKSVGQSWWVSYDYSTGRSWRGPIGKVIIDLRFPEELLGFDVNSWGGAFTLIHRAPGQMLFEMNEVKPKSSELFMASFRLIKYCGPRNSSKTEMLHGYCSSALGIANEGSAKMKVQVDRTKYSTLAVLRLRRNAVYAKEGGIFKDHGLKDFFSNMDWYSPRSDFKESDLTESDKQGIDEIAKLEKTIESAKVLPIPFSVPKD